MKKLRFLTIVMLCVSLLAFAGCGGNNNTGTDVNEGTVASEGTNINDNNGNNNNNNDSVAGDMAEGIDRAANDMADGIDDVTDDLDGKGNSRDTNKDNSNEKTRNN